MRLKRQAMAPVIDSGLLAIRMRAQGRTVRRRVVRETLRIGGLTALVALVSVCVVSAGLAGLYWGLVW